MQAHKVLWGRTMLIEQSSQPAAHMLWDVMCMSEVIVSLHSEQEQLCGAAWAACTGQEAVWAGLRAVWPGMPSSSLKTFCLVGPCQKLCSQLVICHPALKRGLKLRHMSSSTQKSWT